MNIAQCIICSKPFQTYGSKVCPSCLEKMDANFIKVRDYLDDNPNAGVDKVASETEVSRRVIMHLIKEGRLIMGGNKGIGGSLVCEVCKKPIDEGKICNKCKGNLAAMIDKTTGSKPSEASKPELNLKGSAKIGK